MDTDNQLASWPVLPALVARIEAAVRACRAQDPFLPIHIVVPNHVLGTLLARALFVDTGYLSIHVELPHEFAWSVAARDSLGAGLLPVPEEVDLAIVLNAAAAAVTDASTPDYLKRAVQMPGLRRLHFARSATARLQRSIRSHSRRSSRTRRMVTKCACSRALRTATRRHSARHS